MSKRSKSQTLVIRQIRATKRGLPITRAMHNNPPATAKALSFRFPHEIVGVNGEVR